MPDVASSSRKSISVFKRRISVLPNDGVETSRENYPQRRPGAGRTHYPKCQLSRDARATILFPNSTRWRRVARRSPGRRQWSRATSAFGS